MPLPLLIQSRNYAGKPQDFLTFVIEPVLSNLTEIPYVPGAAQLVLGTALTESAGLKFRTQNHGGPARGLFQMEGATHDDIWENFLKYRPALSKQVMKMTINGKPGAADDLKHNDNYAAAMCRVHYFRTAGNAIPGHNQIRGHAKAWKRHYNTPLGKGTEEKYIKDWKAHGGDGVKVRMFTPA